MSLFALMQASALRFPDAPAVSDGTDGLTYARLIARSLAVGASLRRQGVERGDRIVLCMDNCGAYFEILFGSWAAGACVVPVNAKLHAREVSHIVADAGARMIFATERQAGDLDGPNRSLPVPADLVVIGSDRHEAMARAAPLPPVDAAMREAAWLFYTSGTTGRPKGAILSHRNLVFMAMAYFADIATPGLADQMLHVSPLSHGSGLYALPHMLRGAEQIVLRSFDPDAVIEAVNAQRRVSMFLVPTTLTRLMRAPSIDRLRGDRIGTICYGGAPMYQSDLDDAVEMFPGRLFHVYGQGESPMTISGLPQSVHGDREARATCGYARSGVELRVIDENGRDLPPDEIGEVVTRSDCVMEGYWNNAEATGKALRGGWLHTGDLGSLDRRGLLTLKDRSKDLIISGGSNIYPREIEEVLLTHPDVSEAAVVGVPHPDWGEEAVAFVARRPGGDVTEANLDALCLDRIARFKRPKRYVFVESLPKSDYGKILKTTLRRWSVAGAENALEIGREMNTMQPTGNQNGETTR
jgi:long-chain acyl-CoA synthetase